MREDTARSFRLSSKSPAASSSEYELSDSTEGWNADLAQSEDMSGYNINSDNDVIESLSVEDI